MDAMQEAEGQVLTAVWASVHLFDGEMNWDKPGHLMLQFEARAPLTFKCASDGETLRIERTIPEPVDMQESGQFVIADFSARAPWANVTSRRLMHAESLVSHYFGSGTEIGLALIFEGEQPVFIFNLGDDLWTFNTWPEAIAAEEKLKRVRLF